MYLHFAMRKRQKGSDYGEDIFLRPDELIKEVEKFFECMAPGCSV